MSIEHTSRTGADKGFFMVVPEDGCSTMNADWHNASINYALQNVSTVTTCAAVTEALAGVPAGVVTASRRVAVACGQRSPSRAVGLVVELDADVREVVRVRVGRLERGEDHCPRVSARAVVHPTHVIAPPVAPAGMTPTTWAGMLGRRRNRELVGRPFFELLRVEAAHCSRRRRCDRFRARSCSPFPSRRSA